MSKSYRPVLAIVHGRDSVSPMVLAEHAAPICDVVWVVDSDELDDAATLRLLGKLGPTLDIGAMSHDQAADALRPWRPDGIVAYADPLLATASALACRLGLSYHDAATLERLTDKLTQRQALLDGGLPVPRFRPVPARPTPDDVDALAASMDFPVVLKPRRGTASRDTVLVGDACQLKELLAGRGETGTGVEPSRLIEEYLPGACHRPSRYFADYVTVESVVSGGRLSHLAVAGRFPPAAPFRESGFFIPSDFSGPDTRAVLDLATLAVSALGIRTGFVNTEVKITPNGPRIIEVNGRLGGSAPSIMRQASGVALLELSQRAALGENLVFDALLPTDRVGYLFYVQAPQWACRVTGVEGLEDLAAHPGVDSIYFNRHPGDDVTWRKGSQEYVFSVLGAAPDHEGLREMKRILDEAVTVTYA